MALILCPECGNRVSENAAACPKCGYPMPAKPAPAPQRLRTIPPNPPGPVQLPLPPLSTRPPLSTAGFFERLIAYFADAFVITTGIVLVFAAIAVFAGKSPGQTAFDLYGYWLKSYFGMNKDEPMTVLRLVCYVLGFMIRIAYYAGFESSAWQATPGKRLLKLKVVDEAGDSISFGQAAWRNLGKFISALICWIGFLMIFFTAQNQGLHDMMAGTLVIADGRDRPPEQGSDQSPGPYGPLRYRE